MNQRTPLANVRGLGSAKDGTHHWWMQRVTAIALIPLSIWFLACMLQTVGSGQADVLQIWLQDPVTALAMALFVGCVGFHAKLGMQIIIEDYVHKPCTKTAMLMCSNFGFIIVTVMGLMAVLKLHLM